MYKSKYLAAHEIVDRVTYSRFGNSSYRFFDPLLLQVADWLRGELGSVSCNNWYWNRDALPSTVYEWSGLRTARWDEVQPSASGKKKYSPYSDHALGNAFDLRFKEHTAWEVRKFIHENWERMKEAIPGLVSLTLEEGPTISWAHIATRNNAKGINVFNV